MIPFEGTLGVMKRDMKRNVKGFAILAFGFALILAAWCPAQNKIADDSFIRFAISTGVLEADVNPDDALAAAKIWASTLGTSVGTWTQSDAKIYRDLPFLVAAVKNGEREIIALSTEEYLSIEGGLRAEPAFTYVQSGQVELEFIIIAHRDNGFKIPLDLRAKKILIAKGGRNSMVPLWLDSLMFDEKLPVKESFFREIKEVAKASQVILPVFFKQIDAGIVTKSAFDAAVALNPQMGRQLITVATSPKLVPMVTCFSTLLRPERRKLLLEQALKLHENPKGLQSINFFKLERLVQWEPRYFDTIKDLMKKRKLALSTQQARVLINTAAPEERRK
jgi:ABC-type phosphate/phosphonate transport system substrate-binding protein